MHLQHHFEVKKFNYWNIVQRKILLELLRSYNNIVKVKYFFPKFNREIYLMRKETKFYCMSYPRVLANRHKLAGHVQSLYKKGYEDTEILGLHWHYVQNHYSGLFHKKIITIVMTIVIIMIIMITMIIMISMVTMIINDKMQKCRCTHEWHRKAQLNLAYLLNLNEVILP